MQTIEQLLRPGFQGDDGCPTIPLGNQPTHRAPRNPRVPMSELPLRSGSSANRGNPAPCSTGSSRRTLRAQGLSPDDIAARLDISRASVFRKLKGRALHTEGGLKERNPATKPGLATLPSYEGPSYYELHSTTVSKAEVTGQESQCPRTCSHRPRRLRVYPQTCTRLGSDMVCPCRSPMNREQPAVPAWRNAQATIAWDTADTLAVIGDVPAVAGRNNDSCGEIGHVNRGARWFSTQNSSLSPG